MRCLLAIIVSIGFSMSVLAEDAWFLQFKKDHHVVMRTIDGQFQRVLDLGYRPTYGESKTTFGFLSRKSVSGAFVLDLVDKGSGEVTHTFPVTGQVLGQLSGPSKDVMIAGNAAELITVRFLDLPSVERNPIGGAFNFNRLDLSQGMLRTYPLPKEAASPRLVDYEGTPVIYTWKRLQSVAIRYPERRVEGDRFRRRCRGHSSGRGPSGT